MHHSRPHHHLQVRIIEFCLLVTGLMAALLLFGCTPENPSSQGTPGLDPVTPHAADKSSASNSKTNGESKLASTDKEPLPANSLKISGFTVALADDLLSSNNNPFLNKAPIIQEKPAETSVPGSADLPVAPPVDPFQGITLTGILYNPNHPVALLSIGDDVSTNRQLLKKGETFYSNNQGFQVVNMTKNHVQIKQAQGSNTRTLYLPELIGYGKGGSGDTSTENNTSSIVESSLKTPPSDLSKSLRDKMNDITQSGKLAPGESNSSILKLDEP